MPVSESIKAYDIPERVAGYDSDMELMHPNRNKMLEVILELLPIRPEDSFTALDLGFGTGFFANAILARFPNCRLIAVDGAAAMIEMAKSRLGSLAQRVDFRIGDFRHLAKLVHHTKPLDLVYSAYALHHLTSREKLIVLRDVMGLLKAGGWFLNADLTVAADKLTEARIQEMRVSGIVHRAGGRDQRFLTVSSTRAFLDDLEARDHDKPLTLVEDLKTLKEAGLDNASVFWVEYREAITGGFKS
jgi:tRNA (cmo5U34)-methyltransferase